MQSKIAPYVVFFLVATAAVYTGNWLYSLRNKARIAPPDVVSINPTT